MCLDWFRKKSTITVTEVKEVTDIPTTDVIMPASGQTAEEYLNELKNGNTKEPRPTKTEAFYLVQKAGGAYDSKSMMCNGTAYQKIVPKPEGQYQYAYNGWLIQYEIRWEEVKDEEHTVIIPVIEIMNIY